MALSDLFGYGLAAVGTAIFAMSPYGINAKTETPNSMNAVSSHYDKCDRLLGQRKLTARSC